MAYHTAHRTHSSVLVLFAALAASIAAPALAQVSTSGDIFPAVSDDFPIPNIDLFTDPAAFGFPDDDTDGVVDFILPAGNTIDASFLDPVDPEGMTTPGTLPWDDPFVWRGYENQQNVLVGQTGTGTLTITGNADLRFQHLVLGGPGALDAELNPTSSFTQGVDVAAGVAGADFDGINDTLSDIGSNQASGTGIVTISGPNASYNNDPNVISSGLLGVLNAAGGGTNTFFTMGSPDVGGRARDIGYDVYVGLTGTGVLTVDGGGLLETQDALFVGLAEAATGTVTVDGAGSLLNANGRESFDPTANTDSSTPPQTDPFSSIVGGAGTGTLSVTNGGRANFFNGLSIGAGNDGGADLDETGNGAVIVEGPGSTLTAYASNALTTATGLGTNVLALAVGELRDTELDSTINDPLGSGLLRIGDGGTVNVTFTEAYVDQDQVDTNAEVGRNGVVEMRGGRLLLSGDTGGLMGPDGGQLLNDGLIEGYGLIRANTFVNTPVAVLRGEAPQGELGTLSIIINSDGVDPTVPDDFAFLNLGVIEGDLDITVNGGFQNGDDNLAGANSGAIRGSGRIESATFFNRAGAEVSVGPGETLSILAVGDVTAPEDITVLEGDGSGELDPMIGEPVNNTAMGEAYSQANLGTISVDGGTIELGRVLSDGSDMLTNDDRFRNARFVIDNTTTPVTQEIGQITSNDGTLIFQTGLLNTGVVSFTGGDNVVQGEVFNSNEIDYDGDMGVVTDGIPGVILISGDGTTVTFTETVTNNGFLSVGPISTVANFLGDLDNTGGTLEVAVSAFGEFPNSAAIVVSNDVIINDGTIAVPTPFLTAGPIDPGMAIPLLTFGGNLIVESGPALLVDGLASDQAAGLSVTDGQLNLVVVDSATGAFVLGDANGDGLVDAADYVVFRESEGSAVAAGTAGDFNASGFVDQNDLATWRLNYGFDLSVTGGPLAVPEPGAAALVLLAAACTRRRRR